MQKVYDIASADLGTWEWADGHNPKVVQYFADVGHGHVTDDETAWCAAFAGSVLEKAGLKSTRKLTARSYLDWGVPVDLKDAQRGDVVVFWRGSKNGWQGHVAFFDEMSSDGNVVYVLGGNQNNQVNVQGYPADRVLGVRRRKKPLAKSRTISGAAVATAALSAEVTKVHEALLPYGSLDWVGTILPIIAVAGVALAAYARWDDSREKH